MEQYFYNSLKNKLVLKILVDSKLFEHWDFEYEITPLYIHSMVSHKDSTEFEIYDICMN